MTTQADACAPARRVDLTREVCPAIFATAKLHLDRLAPGETLELVLKAGEALRDIPRSIKDEGHRIEAVRREGDAVVLLVRRGAAGAPGPLALCCDGAACCCSSDDSEEGEQTDAP